MVIKKHKNLVTNSIHFIMLFLLTSASIDVLNAQDSEDPFAEGGKGELDLTKLRKKLKVKGNIKVPLKAAFPIRGKQELPQVGEYKNINFLKKAEVFTATLEIDTKNQFKIQINGNPHLKKPLKIQIDKNQDGQFSEDETTFIEADNYYKRVHRYALYSVVELADENRVRKPYSIEIVLDSPIKQAVGEVNLRWKPAGWYQGAIVQGAITNWILVCDLDGNLEIDENDCWLIGRSLQEALRSYPKTMANHNWFALEIPIVPMDVARDGSSITLKKYDTDLTYDQEVQNSLQKQPEFQDEKLPRAKEPIQFSKTLKSALAKAKKSDKKVLIDFTATWCGPCHAMEKFVFTTEKIASYKDRIIFVKVDIDKYPELRKEHKIESVPTLMLMNAEGKIIRRAKGYHTTNQLSALLDSKAEVSRERLK